MPLNVIGGPLSFDAVINGTQFQTQINAMERQLRSLAETARNEGNEMERLGQKVAAAVGGYLSIAAASNFLNKMIQVRGEFQQLEVAFTTMLQSKSKADQLLAEVAELAAKTPFGLQDAAQGTKQLLAYGFQADEIVKTLTTLGNIASGVSAPLNDIVYLYGTLRTQGRAYTQDIRQFTGRGIPIIQELAKQFGVTAEEVNDLVAAGKVGFPDIEKAFASMTSQGGMFFNLMQEQSKTLVGQISNLEDAFDAMLNNIGKSTEGIASTAISGLTFLVENYQAIINILEVLITTYGVYKAAVIAVNTVEKIRTVLIAANTSGLGAMTIAEYLHLQALYLVDKAQKLLNATMLNNPYVATAAVLAALTTALLIMANSSEEVISKEKLLQRATKDASAAIDERTAKMAPYLSILRDANTTENERAVALSKLAELDKSLIAGLNAKNLSQEKLNENVRLYVEHLREQMNLQANQDAITASLKQEQVFRDKIRNLRKEQEDDISTMNNAGSGIFGFLSKREAEKSLSSSKYILEYLNKKLKEQEEITQSLGKQQVQSAAVTTTATKLTNLELIAQAKTLEDIKAVRDKIEKQYQVSDNEKDRLKLANDLLSADQKIKQLDPYAAHKQSAKEAAVEDNKLKKLMEQIADLEAKSTSIREGKEDGSVEKLQNDIDKLVEKAKALNAGEGVILRIKNAGKVLIDDATAKAAAKDIENKLNTELSGINIDLTKAIEGSNQELALKKDVIDKQAELEKNASQSQYDQSVTGRLALAAKLKEIDAKAAKDKLDLDKDYAKRTIDAQLDVLKNQTDIKNLQDQRIVDDPTATLNQRYAAQERILLRNKKSLQDMVSLLEEFAKAGKGDTKELNKLMGDLELQIAGVNNELGKTSKQHLIDVFDNLYKVLGASSSALRGFASDIAGVNDGLSDTLNTMADLVDQIQQVAGVATAVGSISGGKTSEKGNSALSTIGGLAGTGAAIGSLFPGLGNVIGAVVGAVAGVVVTVLKGGKKVRESLQKTYEAIYSFQLNQELGEYRINALLRQRNILKAQEAKLTLDNIKAQRQALALNQQQNKADQDRIMALLQQESFITGVDKQKYGGFLGLWRKSQAVNQYGSLLGMTIDDIEKLYQSGQLDGRAKSLFEQLKQLQDEGQNIQQQLDSLAQQAKEVFTGTTADSITDSIVDGFKNGLFAAQDFASDFEELMRNAALNALKYQYLEGPLNDFYDQFAADAESDGTLTASEIAELQQKYNDIIKKAGEQFQQIQDITQLNLGSGSGKKNSLAGEIKGITEQQADLLAGQFGGLRISMVQQVQICTQQLSVLNAIKIDTANLADIRADIRYLKTTGIKITK